MAPGRFGCPFGWAARLPPLAPRGTPCDALSLRTALAALSLPALDRVARGMKPADSPAPACTHSVSPPARRFSGPQANDEPKRCAGDPDARRDFHSRPNEEMSPFSSVKSLVWREQLALAGTRDAVERGGGGKRGYVQEAEKKLVEQGSSNRWSNWSGIDYCRTQQKILNTNFCHPSQTSSLPHSQTSLKDAPQNTHMRSRGHTHAKTHAHERCRT